MQGFLFGKNGQQCEYNDGRNQRGKENVGVGHKGIGAVVIKNLFGIGQNRFADIRSNDAGNKNLREDAYSLQHTCFAGGSQITDFGSENSHTGQIAAHHEKGTNEDGCGSAEDKQNDVAEDQPNQGNECTGTECFFVVDSAPESSHDRGQDNGRCHDKDIVGHAQRNFVVNDQIGHKNLNGNVKQNESSQMDVKRGVSLNRGWAEAIDHVLDVTGLGRCDLYVVNQEETQNTDQQNYHADDNEDRSPAFGTIQIECHKAAKDHEDGHKRHHGVDTLGRTTVGVVGTVSQPCVESGVIGAGAEEGHNAVQNDRQ